MFDAMGRASKRRDREQSRQSAVEIGTPVSTANVSNPPTDAELDTAFGTPAAVGAGFTAIVDDNDADTAVWFVVSNGTSWWYEALTKAV